MIRLRLFGYPTVWQDEEQITGFVSEKVIALLVFLVVSHETHARDYLTGLLWGQSTDKKAKASLRSALYNLGQLLPGFLEVTRKTVSISTSAIYQVDVDLLRQQRHAESHMADFLAGFYISDAPEFELWLLREREQLRQLAISHWEAAAKETDSESLALAAYDALCRLEPWRESAYRAQMQLLARRGAYADALKIYQHCVQMLDQELDMPPTAETEQLADRIRLAQTLPRHNIPAEKGPFLGRDALMDQIESAVQSHRLVSLVGLGGSGKTSTACMFGRRCARRFLHGVVFVPLEGVRSNTDSAIASAIVQAMVRGDMLSPTREPEQPYLLSQIAKRDMLLILDNMDHLMHDAELIDDLLAAGPDIHILLTSRERLQHAQERLILIDGLMIQSAIELFTTIARQIQPHQLPDSTVAQICELVNGLPLAIELAASWVDVQTPQEILEDLQRSLSILQDDSPYRSKRQQSIETILEQAWLHLSIHLQSLLTELSYFRGGFTASAAKSIAGASSADLRKLKNRALIQEMAYRFQLHPLLKQFVQTKGEPELVQAYASYYLESYARVGEEQQVESIRLLLPDYENFTKAWLWAAEHEPFRLLNPAGHLRFLFSDRGMDEHTNHLVQYALDRIGDCHPQLKVRLILEKVYYLYWQAKKPEEALACLHELSNSVLTWENMEAEFAYFNTLWGWICNYHLRRLDQAEHYFQQAADIWEKLNNLVQLASRQLDLGNVAYARHDNNRASYHWENCSRAARSTGYTIGYAAAEFSLSRLAIIQQEFAKGEQKLELAKPYLNEHHGLHVSWLELRGKLCIWQEEFDAAEETFQQQLEVCKIYARVDRTIDAYGNLGRFYLLRGEPRRAESYFIQAEALATQHRLERLREKIDEYRSRPQFRINEV